MAVRLARDHVGVVDSNCCFALSCSLACALAASTVVSSSIEAST